MNLRLTFYCFKNIQNLIVSPAGVCKTSFRVRILGGCTVLTPSKSMTTDDQRLAVVTIRLAKLGSHILSTFSTFYVLPQEGFCSALCRAHLLHSDRNAASPRMLWLDQLAVLKLLSDSLIYPQAKRRIITHRRGHQAT